LRPSALPYLHQQAPRKRRRFGLWSCVTGVPELHRRFTCVCSLRARDVRERRGLRLQGFRMYTQLFWSKLSRTVASLQRGGGFGKLAATVYPATALAADGLGCFRLTSLSFRLRLTSGCRSFASVRSLDLWIFGSLHLCCCSTRSRAVIPGLPVAGEACVCVEPKSCPEGSKHTRIAESLLHHDEALPRPSWIASLC